MKIIILMLALSALSLALTPILIPKIVWTYAADPFSMSTLQSLCIDNLRRYAQLSGYAFKLVTNQNYTLLFKDWHQVATVTELSHLNEEITIQIAIKLKILIQFGGIWIDSNVMLIESLSWLQKLGTLPEANNRMNDPEVVLFYEPHWLDETERRTVSTQQDVVVTPNYRSWFIATSKSNPFIKKLKTLFFQTVSAPYESALQTMAQKDIQMSQYLSDQLLFFPWLMKTVIELHQKELDKEKVTPRQLAVKEYKITAIDITRTSNTIDEEARNRENLVSKYMAELTLHQLKLELHYAVRIEEKVGKELVETLEKDYVDLGHFHSGVNLFCDGQIIPLRYIVRDSVIQKYLLDSTTRGIPVYDEDYIRHHCQASFIEVYLLLGKYLFFLALFIVNVVVIRKALLWLKPQWGVRKKIVEFEQSDL